MDCKAMPPIGSTMPIRCGGASRPRSKTRWSAARRRCCRTISPTCRCSIHDSSSKTGGVVGVYVQDEWRLTDKLTLNAGLRFDQMWQYVDANQLSPRVNLIYKPTEAHDLPRRLCALLHAAAAGHCGAGQYRRLRRHDQPHRTHSSKARCNRSARTISISAYRTVHAQPSDRRSTPITNARRNLLDDGQFGAALILRGSTTIAAKTRASS